MLGVAALMCVSATVVVLIERTNRTAARNRALIHPFTSHDA
jgi:hypothetical protein